MSPPSYTVALDLNDDGDFVDSGEVLSADVIKLEWQLGLTKPFDSLAAPIHAGVTLRNVSRTYSPEYTSNPLKPGKPIRIQSNDGTTTRTHFTGFIDSIEPSTGTQGERIVVIHARGTERELAQNQVRLAPQINVRADLVIQAIFDAVRLRYAVLNGYMVVGVSGYDVIGTGKLFGAPVTPNLESAKSILPHVADTWGEGIPADTAIREVVESERGRFFVNASGVPTFYNRHHTLLNITPAATFANNMEGLDYGYGAQVINRVQVRIVPRSVGVAGSVLWQLGSPLRVDPGQVRQVIARYRDVNLRPIGASAVIAPKAGLDYLANTKADGTGADRTTQAAVVLVGQNTASAATLEFRNNTTATFYILVGMQLRGTPLNLTDPLTVEQSDSTSITFYGMGTLLFNLPAFTAAEDASQFARYELARRKDPQGIVHSIQVSSATLLTQVLTRTLFDRITVQDAQTNHARDYFIVAEEHTVDLGSTRHRVTWLLEPADSDIFFVIGSHKPDGSRVLTY
jgi:hypothetical protein